MLSECVVVGTVDTDLSQCFEGDILCVLVQDPEQMVGRSRGHA